MLAQASQHLIVPSTTEETDHAQAAPLRVAVIGCGAITQQLHLPVLAGHEGVQLIALVDRDIQRAKTLAQGYGVHTVLADTQAFEELHIQAAVIATPPFHHAPCAIDLLQRGIHVLVEKPMATTYQDAVAMVETAAAYGVTLAVGLFRRLFPSVRLLKGLLDSLWLGHPVHFVVEGGGLYSWQATTLANMRKDWAGGGVLSDFGSHMLDLLLAFLEEPAEVVAYRDNALGGIEADCFLALRLHHQGRAVEGTVELARTRNIGNFIRIICEQGALEWHLSERFRLRVTPHDGQLYDTFTACKRPYWLTATWEDTTEDLSWYETFRTQIDDWLNAIRTRSEPQLSGRSTLATVQLIETCYQQAQGVEAPWVYAGFPSQPLQPEQRSPVCAAQLAPASGLRPSRRGKTPRRVLVTGATGFIGSRVAEVLCLREGWEVRALVHNPGNASRLARLPVEMVQGDLRAAPDAQRLVEGCDAVVHCAVGTSWGRRREIFAVTVDGTQHIAAAALQCGVSRMVHLSTMAVYGDLSQRGGNLDESTPISPVPGDEYSESKVAAEQVLQSLARRGLPVVLLRPARVFGPYAQTFISRPLRAMAQGQFHWLGPPDVPCDMLYVDNLVEAIICALTASEAETTGEIFTISDGESMTWREFYTYFAQQLDFDLSQVSVREPQSPIHHGYTQAMLTWLWDGYESAQTLLTSPELRALGQRVLQTDPWGQLPRWALERFPGLERFVRRCLKADTSLPIYRRTTDVAAEEIGMGSGGARLSIAKAQRVLGYQPPISREYAMQLTLQWVQYARLLS